MDTGIGLLDFLIEAELQHYYDQIKTELKILKTSQLKYVTEEDLSQLGMSRPEQRRLKKFFTKYYSQNYFSRIKKLLGPGRKDDSPSSLSSLSEKKIQELQADVTPESCLRNPNKHIIPPASITINKEIGVGEFGVVQQGVWTNEGHRTQVAIKSLSRERMQSNSMEFLKEAAIMYSINHECIVRLYGVVLHPDCLMLVTELAPLRSLLECLKELSLRPSFPVLTLCDFAAQICEGMTYLENKRLIHRDLAARNVLVFTKNKVKISDFGLSRALRVGKDYYQTNFNVNLKLPIAWCAPECITYLRFTSASDVWAYAVTLWEMFSYGFQPWAAFSGHQILVAIDAPNFQRLEQPECCPREYFALMQKCWQHEPGKRPKFSEILHLLPDCKPEQVQAVCSSEVDTCRADQLSYRCGDIVTVLDKGGNPAATYWKGILNNGTTGFFNPQNVVSYLGSSLPSSGNQGVFSRSTTSSDGAATSSLRNSLIRSDTRSTSKRRLRSDMISAPQGEVKHTGHVGLDGAYFGDISFLEYNHLPRQIVTPYKPSEDLEQTPLINPNSPSHLTGNNTPLSSLAHPILLREASSGVASPSSSVGAEGGKDSKATEGDSDKRYGPSVQYKGHHFNLNFDSLSLQSHLAKVKWPGHSKNAMSASGSGANSKSLHNDACSANDFEAGRDAEAPHEYQEISDDDDQKASDFGQSLLEEMESMFRRHSKSTPSSPNQDPEGTNHRNELTELSSRLNNSTLSKKKQTVKQISAHDHRVLESAIALANELTAKSMSDLEHKEAPSTPNTPNEKGNKFSFRFPLGGGGGGASSLGEEHSTHAPVTSKDTKAAAEQFGSKRNFSQEAQSVPDIQSSLTEESRLAYESLVEQPAKLVTTLMKIRQKQGSQPNSSHRNMVKLLPAKSDNSLTKCNLDDQCTSLDTVTRKNKIANMENNNPLPLPPRDRNASSQSSRKRHTRKYPLIIQDSNLQRTLNRVNPQFLTEHSLKSSTESEKYTNTKRNRPSEERYENSEAHNELINRNETTGGTVNSSVGQYQNISYKFSFHNEDSFDPPSLKFEDQIENNFNSVDCCDGVTSDSDFEGNSLSPKADVSKYASDSAKEKKTKEQDASLNFYNIANLEYIDGPSCSVNPFMKLENKSLDETNNVLENKENFSSKNSGNPGNELSQHALFNKIKTDLQSQDMLVSIKREEPPAHGDAAITKLENTDETSESLSPKKNKPKSQDTQVLTHKGKHKDVDWSLQRRSIGDNSDEPYMFVKGSPDRVSVEDLLEFADQKPCGRQRGTESDEVRIMCKVLNHQVSPESCLVTLEFASWNVHRAIKLERLRALVPSAPLPRCAAALDGCAWDVARAALLLNTS